MSVFIRNNLWGGRQEPGQEPCLPTVRRQGPVEKPGGIDRAEAASARSQEFRGWAGATAQDRAWGRNDTTWHNTACRGLDAWWLAFRPLQLTIKSPCPEIRNSWLCQLVPPQGAGQRQQSTGPSQLGEDTWGQQQRVTLSRSHTLAVRLESKTMSRLVGC